MVRFSRVWRAVLCMGHPQVRWSVQLMTQNGGIPAQFQGDREGQRSLTTKSDGMWHLSCNWLQGLGTAELATSYMTGHFTTQSGGICNFQGNPLTLPHTRQPRRHHPLLPIVCGDSPALLQFV